MEPQIDSRPPRLTDAGAQQPGPAHLGEMLDSLSDGFMSIDRSWRFTYLNHTAERYLQQDRRNLLGRDIWQCYPDLVDSGYYHVYQLTAATGRPSQHTDFYAPLGRWFEARSFAHDDGITVLLRDVTREYEHAAQLKRKEEELADLAADSQRRRRLYETFLENSPDLAYVFDLNHRFTYANKVLLNTWNRTWEEAIGRNCLELGYEPWHAEMHDREIEEV
ncbi:PAS domain-containing protein [Caballeronia grimmiae]|uniref:PAS domain-containing protein n=1 Tax=Caballeronia grimmiae TaxID=1071679 RepID=UPI0038BAB575